MILYTDISILLYRYALFDLGYQNQKAFGFFADIGNGYMTLVPSILYIICMIRPIMSAQIIGIIGVLKFYQEAYGTLVYFVSYMYNKRYEGTNLFVSFSFVLLANGIWYVYI